MAKARPHTRQEALYNTGGFKSMLSDRARSAGWNINILGKNDVDARKEGIILPSYDYDLDTCDLAFPSSVAPFWKNEADENWPKHFAPQAWGQVFIVWTFMGPDNVHFFSPVNRASLIGHENVDPGGTDDAFDDLCAFIRKKTTGFTTEEKDYYLKRNGAKSSSRVPTRKFVFASLTLVTDKDSQGKWRPEVLLYTPSAHDYLIRQARWDSSRDAAPRSKQYPQYLLGDPTDPSGALVWAADKFLIDPRDPQETNIMRWTQQREILDNPVRTRPISTAEIMSRIDLQDPENWSFPSYQEQVNFMIQHYTEVPEDLIKRACGHRADVPSRKPGVARQDVASPKTRDDDDNYDPLTGTFGPAPVSNQSVAPAPVAPAPVATSQQVASSIPDVPATVPTVPVVPATVPIVPAVPEPTYLTGLPGQKPEELTAAQIAARNVAGLMVMVDGAWKTVAASGLVPASVPAAVPQVPVAAVPDSVPAPSGAERAKAFADIFRTPEDVARYTTMSAEDKAVADKVIDAVTASRVNGTTLESGILDLLGKVVDPSFT